MLYHFSYQFFVQIHNLKRKMQICEALKKRISDIRAEIAKNRPKSAKMGVKKKTTLFFEGLNSKTKTQKSCLPSIGRFCMFQFFNLGPKQRVFFFTFSIIFSRFPILQRNFYVESIKTMLCCCNLIFLTLHTQSYYIYCFKPLFLLFTTLFKA